MFKFNSNIKRPGSVTHDLSLMIKANVSVKVHSELHQCLRQRRKREERKTARLDRDTERKRRDSRADQTFDIHNSDSAFLKN